ncbi:hypothetical protein H7X87_04510 [Acetobacteraceae bacterium]|nr:hypothetical protein [Candidatus Parcubacteria bacterium]
MNKWTIAVIVLVIALIGAIFLVMMPPKATAPTTATTTPDGSSTNNNGTSGGTTGGSNITKAGITDLITVDVPTVGSKIVSPIMILGSARGTWYFEGSFPIEIRNETGALIGEGHAEAQGEWMTDNFVQFTSTIMFQTQPEGRSGSVVLKKDNPSGNPERDQSVIVPITF